MTIQEMHHFVLDYLLEKKQERFSLRPADKSNEEKLSQGYWFLGNDEPLQLSFWDSYDWVNKTPNIFFSFRHNAYWFELVDKSGGEKARFFHEIARMLNLAIVAGQVGRYMKRYPEPTYKSDSYVNNALSRFLAIDKPLIDALIISKNKLHLFPPISAESFEANLKQIQLRRQLAQTGIPKRNHNPIIYEPLRLKSVILTNIIHFKSIKIELDQQITCIVGENGSGKSSILKAIGLGLAGISNNTVLNIMNDNLQKMLRIQKIETNKPVYDLNGEITLYYNHDKNHIHFHHQKGELANIYGEISRDLTQINDMNSDLTATNGNNFKNLVLGFSQIKKRSDHKVPFQGETDVKPRISEVTNLIYNLPDEAFEHFGTWMLRLWSVHTTPKLRKAGLQTLTDIFAIIKRIVGGTFELLPMQVEQGEVFIKTTDAPNGIPLRLMSQGYNNVIGWVGHFMRRLWEVTPDPEKANFKKTPAICLIDEIDTYLHPKWEQKILAVLAEEFPNTQFVVTTHSPIVLANLKDNYRIYTIAQADDGQMVAFEHQKRDFNPYGASSSEVIRRLMHVQERPESVQKQMDAYNQAIIQNDFAKAAHFEAQLKQLIDPHDPDIIEGEASIEARKMIQDL
ncbi:MAG: hypothetical protein RL329_3062 [Bacteroidota bacterium]